MSLLIHILKNTAPRDFIAMIDDIDAGKLAVSPQDKASILTVASETNMIERSLLNHLGRDKYLAAIRNKESIWHSLADLETLQKSLYNVGGKSILIGGFISDEWEKGRSDVKIWKASFYNPNEECLSQFIENVAFADDNSLEITDAYSARAIVFINALSKVYSDTQAQAVIDRNPNQWNRDKLRRDLPGFKQSPEWQIIGDQTLDMFQKLAALTPLHGNVKYRTACKRLTHALKAHGALNEGQIARLERIEKTLPFLAEGQDLKKQQNQVLKEIKGASRAKDAAGAFARAVTAVDDIAVKMQPYESSAKIEGFKKSAATAFEDAMPKMARAIARANIEGDALAVLASAIKMDAKLTGLFLSQYALAASDPARIELAAKAFR